MKAGLHLTAMEDGWHHCSSGRQGMTGFKESGGPLSLGAITAVDSLGVRAHRESTSFSFEKDKTIPNHKWTMCADRVLTPV